MAFSYISVNNGNSLKPAVNFDIVCTGAEAQQGTVIIRNSAGIAETCPIVSWTDTLITATAPPTLQEGVGYRVETTLYGESEPVYYGDNKADTFADLRNIEPTIENQVIELIGHTESGIGGGTFYAELDGSSYTDDNGVYAITTGGAVWIRETKKGVAFSDFGAINNIDSTASIQSAINFTSINDVSLIDNSKASYIISGRVNNGVDTAVILLKSNCEINTNCTLKILDNNDSVDAVVTFENGSTNSQVKIKVDANRDNQTNSIGTALSASHSCSNIDFIDCVVSNSANRSLVSNNYSDLLENKATNIKFINPKVFNANDKCVVFRATTGGSVVNGEAYTNITDSGSSSGALFEASYSSGILFDSLRGSHTNATYKAQGVRCVNNSEDITVNNVNIGSTSTGVFVSDCKNVSISDGLISSCDDKAIFIESINTDMQSDGIVSGIDISSFKFPLVSVGGSTEGVRTNVSSNGVSLEANLCDLKINGAMSNGLRSGLDTDIEKVSFSGLEFSGNTGDTYSGRFVAVSDSQRSSYRTNQVSIADNSVYIKKLPFSGKSGIIMITIQDLRDWAACIVYRSDGAQYTADAWNLNPTRLNTTTGALDGTTGTDGNFTVSVDDDSNLYLENRVASTRTASFTILSSQ